MKPAAAETKHVGRTQLRSLCCAGEEREPNAARRTANQTHCPTHGVSRSTTKPISRSTPELEEVESQGVVAIERHLLGEWRQIEPDSRPAAIYITFEADGRLRYTVEADTIQHILLTWYVEGNVLVTDQPSAPRQERTYFKFMAPSRLVLERNGETYSYERV